MAELLVASGSKRISALTSVSGISGSTAMPIVMGGNTIQVSHTDFLATTLLNQSNTFSGNNTFGGQTTLLNGLVNGNLVVKGDLTANQYIISSSISHITTSFSSGSTKFGDSLDDTHQFTGSVSIDGNVTATSFTGSLSYTNLTDAPTLVSGSSQITDLLPDGVVSGSSQVSFNGIVDKPTLVSGSSQVSFNGIIDKPTLVSSSAQVISLLPAGTVSGSSQVSFNGIIDKPTLVSSSQQIRDYGIFATTGSNIFVGNQTITGSLNTKDGGFSVSSGSGFLTSSLAFTHNTISPTQGYSLLTLRHINNDFNENFALKLFADDYIAKIQYEQNNVTYDILRTNLAGDVHLTQNTRLFGTDLTIDGALEVKQNARVTGSLVVSGSGLLIGNQTITGSVGVSGSVNADSFTLDATSTTSVVALNTQFNFDLSSSQTPQIYKTLLLSDGKILVAGRFQSIDGHVTDDIARLNSNGSVDTSFTATNIGGGITPPSQLINTFVTQSDDKIIIVGSFSSVQGNLRTGVARLNTDGTLDSGFSNPGLTTFSSVRDVVIQSDDKIVIVGRFDGGIKRLNTDGTIDTSLSVPDTTGFTDNAFYSVAIQNSGSAEHILVGGDFTQWNTSANYDKLVKLSISGALDTGFAGANLNISNRSGDVIRKIKLDSNNDIFIAGLFTGSTQHANIARISSEDNGLDGRGSFDSSFATYTNGTVRDFEFYDTDKILVGGDFEASGVTAAFQYSAFRFVIVNESDGQAASGFSASNYLITNNSIYSVTPVGTNVILGGTFTTVNSNSRENIASLKLSGIGSVTTSKDYVITADTQKLLVSSSNTFFSGDVNISGSVTASIFVGDGSGLTGVTAGGVDFDDITNKPTLFSSSIQVDADTITNFDANVLAYNNSLGVVSGSSQVSYPDLSNIPNGIISSSAQIDLLFDIDGLVSSSEQVLDYDIFTTTSSFNSFTSSYNTGSFTGSFFGDGSGLFTGSFSGDGSGLTGVIETGSFATTGSNTFIGNQIVTGSVTISGSISQVGVGNGNLIIGSTPLTNLSTGIANTIIGNIAGVGLSTGGANTYVGEYAGGLNQEGSNNTFVGRRAGEKTTVGQNTFVGANAGNFNTTGTDNAFFGYYAGYNNLTPSNNTFIGLQSGFNNRVGAQNTFVGARAGEDNISGSNNTFVGDNSGLEIISGSSNSFFGKDAGRFIANGSTGLTFASASVFLGTETKANGNNETNQIVIGHGVIGNGSNTVVIGNASITSTTLRGSVSASLFSGSFVGDGSGLTGVTAADVEFTNILNRPTLVSSSTQVLNYGIFATTGSNTFVGNQIVTGSFDVTGSLVVNNDVEIENGYVVLTRVSQSLEFANDAAAAAGGVPLGGLYRSGNFILIRLV